MFQWPRLERTFIQEIDKLNDGSVKVAAGTMYGAIENLLKLNLIEEIPSRPHRRKEGKNLLKGFLPSLRRWGLCFSFSFFVWLTRRD